MAKVSVIIRVTNESNRIDELFECLIVQTEKDMEIFCVTESDNIWLPLLKNYAIFDERIKIVEKESQQNALRTVLPLVNSPYIIMLHPSSFLNIPYIEKMLQMSSFSERIDFVYAPMRFRDEMTNEFRRASFLVPEDFSAKSADVFLNSEGLSPKFLSKADKHIYGKLLRTELVKKILLDMPEQYNDVVLFYKCLFNSREIGCTLYEMMFEWKNADPFAPASYEIKDETQKISVVIPIYNVRTSFLRQCLDSLRLQTYKNLEIICVDDGSTDGTLKFLKDYAAQDVRFKVLTKKNGGVSSARNFGIKAATGDYISFIDADDFVSLALYQKFVAAVQYETEQIDMYEYNGFRFSEVYDKPITLAFLHFGIEEWGNFYTGHFKNFREYCNLSHGTIWNKIFRTEFLKKEKILFPEGIVFEDNVFSTEAFLKAKTLYVAENYMYIYRHYGESQVNNLNHKVFDVFKEEELLQEILKEANYYDQAKYKLFDYVPLSFWLLFPRCPEDEQELFLQKTRECLNSFLPIPEEVLRKNKYTNMYNDIMNPASTVEYFREKILKKVGKA